MSNGRTRMKKVVGASAAALMMAALLTGCENKCGIKEECLPCEPYVPATVVDCTPAQTSARVSRVVVVSESLTPSIAVMPFQCFEGCPESGLVVADALADSLTANNDGWVIHSPAEVTTAVQFKDGDPIDPVEVGRRMNAPYILTGRVTDYRMPGEESELTSVGVTARLIDTKTGLEVWTAKQYEEYMSATLKGWSDAVTSDLVMAINPKPPVTSTVIAVNEPLPPPVPVNDLDTSFDMAMNRVIPDIEVDMSSPYDEYDLVLGVEVEVSSTEELRFGSDTNPDDFGLQLPEPEYRPSGPVGEEFGVVAGRPVTATYGKPVLPVDEVGRILDRFEDPSAPRYYTPPPAQPTEPTGTMSFIIPAPPVTVVETTVQTDTAYSGYLTSYDLSPAEPKTLSTPDYTAMTRREQGGAAENKEFRYVGANPYADSPGKKAADTPVEDWSLSDLKRAPAMNTEVEAVLRTPPMSELPTVTVATRGPAVSDALCEPYPPAGQKSETSYFEPMTLEAPAFLSGPSETAMKKDTGTEDFLKSLDSGPGLYMPEPLEPVAASSLSEDMSAMAAPELPGDREVMYMPEPLKMEPVDQKPQAREVPPSEDGSFKVTISAEQLLNDSEFDFFGSLSDSLADMEG